ncbi:MAG TPA: phosphoribosyltransferase family protein [Patescibacteria group bacterium]|nr:phosphoribosyltransferase family protein [Patescibacteria group bacterium]
MIFNDRRHAGKILAQKLLKLKLNLKNTTVAAIPRGGVAVAVEIADTLGVAAYPLVIKKIGAPQNPELAIGACASWGKPVWDRWLIADLKIPADYLKKELLNKKREAQAREKFLDVKISPARFKGKIVIVVDDGLATGQTVIAASKIIREFEPKELILSVPCGSPAVIEKVEADYDKVICIEQSADYWAVGQFYKDFAPVSDSEVKEMLTAGYR